MQGADVSRETIGAKGSRMSEGSGSNTIDIVAIDGPGGVGKSSTAKRLAALLGYHFLSSGMIYRAMAWFLLGQGWRRDTPLDLAPLQALKLAVNGQGRVFANGVDISAYLAGEEISAAASLISPVPAVRERANALQRETVAAIARDRSFPGVILEGRDIGTVVFPEARHKFFLTAREDVRADRRFKEQAAAEPSTDRESVQKALQERDARDAGRKVAPLVPAADARIVDTSRLTLDEVVALLLGAIRGQEGSAPPAPIKPTVA
jgi:cytidylate kinase